MRNDPMQLLNSFASITLSEMDNVKLLNRTDTKFAFNYQYLPIVLSGLPEHYKILDVNGVKQNRYETLYFDTQDFQLYMNHHNGHTNRYKVRYRKYVDSDLVFFEIKYKNNKGRTIKSRIKQESINEKIEGRSTELLIEKTHLTPESLFPKLWVNYSRITLVNKLSTERLTIDIDLLFKKGQQEVIYKNLVIAELKQAKAEYSPFISIMKNNHLREGSISKYCLGVISILKNIKSNNFKQGLLQLKKCSNEYIT